MLKNRKILVTGATGEVARAIVTLPGADNEIWGAARFSDPSARDALEARGVRTFRWSLGSDDLDGLPTDFDHVVHAAASIFDVRDDYDEAVRQNAEGAGLLMHHVRNAGSFLFVSTQHVYTDVGDSALPRREADDLGRHPNYAPSYSIGKIAAEAVVRTLCRIHRLPTTIARLGMNYGAGCSGVLDIAFRKMLAGERIIVPPRGKAICGLVHNGTLAGQVSALLGAATVPATIVNWTADEAVDIRTIYDYMAGLAGLTPDYVESSDATPLGGSADPARRIAVTGPDPTDWRANIREMIAVDHPQLNIAPATAGGGGSPVSRAAEPPYNMMSMP